MWGLKRPANIPKWTPWNSWCTKVLNSEGFAHGKLVGAPWHNLIGWWGVLWKMKFVVFEIWGLERPKKVPKWRPLSSWCTKVLSFEGFAHGKLVGAPRHNLIGWWGVLWKKEIRGFWDVRVGNDVTPTSPSSSASTSRSPYQGPITRSMMRKIHMGLSQDDQVNHGLFTLFTWAKEISKIWDDAWRK